MKKIFSTLSMVMLFNPLAVSANTFGVEVKFDGSELPYFGISANWIRNSIVQLLQANGHTVVDTSNNPKIPYVYAHFAGWDTKMDSGRTLLGKSEGVLLLIEPLQVVSGSSGKKKNLETKTVWASTKYRLCNGIATDDRRDTLQDGLLRCISNFVNYK